MQRGDKEVFLEDPKGCADPINDQAAIELGAGKSNVTDENFIGLSGGADSRNVSASSDVYKEHVQTRGDELHNLTYDDARLEAQNGIFQMFLQSCLNMVGYVVRFCMMRIGIDLRQGSTVNVARVMEELQVRSIEKAQLEKKFCLGKDLGEDIVLNGKRQFRHAVLSLKLEDNKKLYCDLRQEEICKFPRHSDKHDVMINYVDQEAKDKIESNSERFSTVSILEVDALGMPINTKFKLREVYSKEIESCKCALRNE